MQKAGPKLVKYKYIFYSTSCQILWLSHCCFFIFVSQYNCVTLPDKIQSLHYKIFLYNDNTYNLTGLIWKNGLEHIPVIRCEANDKLKGCFFEWFEVYPINFTANRFGGKICKILNKHYGKIITVKNKVFLKKTHCVNYYYVEL